MNRKLELDLDHFFRVYQADVSDDLKRVLHPSEHRQVGAVLEKNLDLLKASIFNRIAEE